MNAPFPTSSSTDFAASGVADDGWLGEGFFRCEDPACGLRFPVAIGDPFYGHCPRCGAPAQLVERVMPDEGDLPVASAASPVSQIHLLLDNWRSLFNVGAAFRTADGAGLQHLYLCGISATPAQPKLAKTALGAEQSVGWSYHADALTVATSLRSAGMKLWVLERDPKAQTLFDITSVPTDAPLVVAAGNEVIGVDPGLVAMADQVIQLPMLGSKASLNVAVALSVAAYWLRAHSLNRAR